MINGPVRGSFFLAVSSWDPVDAFSDAEDVVLLGDQKRDDHFPEVLIQNPDAASKLRRSFQIGVFRVNRFYINAIVSFQVKIVFPERLELFLAAVKAHGLTFLGGSQVFILCTDLKFIFRYPLHPETLAGIADLRKIKIRNFFYYHLTTPLLSFSPRL